jgi:hypothetical protein
MVNELLPLIAIVAVVFGVFLSIAKGFGNRPEGESFKVGRLISSLIIGVMGTLSVSLLTIGALTEQVSDLGLIAFAFLFIGQGFATDSGLSALDK